MTLYSRFFVDSANIKIGARFDRIGHAMQVYFSRDPGRIRQTLEEQVRPGRTTSMNIGMELDDVFAEKVNHLERFLAHEDQYYILA